MSSFLKFGLSLISIALSSCSRWQQELGPAYLSTKRHYVFRRQQRGRRWRQGGVAGEDRVVMERRC
uniref:Secreted protein n=1 Tax=Oryza barthii TaxID=65489 RepID=A0A0D3GYG7_9ORYZ